MAETPTSSNSQLLDHLPMTRAQVAAVAMTIALNALDGFDVLSISFASPGIAKDWGVDRAALGIVLSMELIGMALGSVLLGGVADKIGRRPTILGSLVAMALGMFGASIASGVTDLSVYRLVTGLGIGGVLASINAVAAEFSNAKNRPLALSLMVIGYPVGAVIGGIVASYLLAGGGWRSIFEFGAVVTALCIPLTLWLIPETPSYLVARRNADALDRVNRVFRRLGHAAIAALPPMRANASNVRLADIFAPRYLATTVLITLAYFAHITTFYFMAKWVPTIVVDMGFAPSSAAGVLAWVNVGGAIGGALFGVFALRIGLRPLTIAVLIGSVISVILFGRGYSDLAALSLVCAVVGFFTNSGIAGLYALLAQAFPTHVRATGTGFAIGVGRGGAALAPVLTGFLFAAGLDLQLVAIVMAMGSLFGIVALLFLKLPDAAE